MNTDNFYKIRQYFSCVGSLKLILSILIIANFLLFNSGIAEASYFEPDFSWRDRTIIKNYKSSIVAQNDRATNLPSRSNSLPDRVASAVLKDASKRSKLPTSQLSIFKSTAKEWPDGCLGLASPDTFCTQAIVSGWQVIVEGKGQHLVYRTNDSGSLVELEKTKSR
ncbi:MAG: hypothetical protein ACRC2R_10120 [Xenococcaceae cyanobacterium]